MRLTATGPGSPLNGLPEPKRYRWRGEEPPAMPAPAQRGRQPTAAERQKRREALARMAVNDEPVNSACLPDGVLTCDQAAAMFGVTKRTILRDLRALRATAETS